MRKYFVAIALCILIAGCAPTGKVTQQEPIVVGATLTLSGFGAPWGEHARNGMELAINEINAGGGINGVPLKAMYEDYQEIDLKRAASAAHKLVEIDGARVVFTQWAEDTEVVAPIAAQSGVVTVGIDPGSAGLTHGKPLLFRIRPSDEAYANAVTDYLLENDVQRPVLIAEQISYYINMKDYYAEFWKQKTDSNLEVYEVPAGTKDFRSILTKMGKPDAVIVQVNYGDEGNAFKQMQELGMKPKVRVGFQGDPKVIVDSAGSAANGMVYAQYKSASTSFSEKYWAAYGEDPVAPADEAYDAVILVAKVMRERGTDAPRIREGLEAVRDYPGATGPLTIDPLTHDRLGREVELVQLQDGRPVAIA